MKRNGLILVALSAALALPAVAQNDEEPDRGVARISVLNGDVSVRRGDSGDVIAAAINGPLVLQDRLLTGAASRAEVQFDSGNMIRVGANSEIRLSELEYRRYQIQVAVGTTTFRVLRDTNAEVELATPSVSVRPLKKGVYRVTVREDGTTEVTVRGGEADIYTPRGSERLGAGKTMLARGSASDPEFQVIAAIPPDDWDRWNESRDRDLQRTRTYEYVSADIYGAEDLDPYGRWVYTAPYGYVWSPVVASGWAPYRYGRWVWIDWYGWTWVSYDPWGWAPYHYGRWFWNGGNGWCWWPGARSGRHYWSPALVAFFGWGSYGGFRTGIGWGWGNIGWVPLAPHDPWNRWWGRGYYGRGFGNNVTIVNNTNITNIYRNARIVNGITGVEAGNFGRGHINNNNIVRVSSADIARANLVRGQVPLAPGRESLSMSDRPARTAAMPNVNENRNFYSRRQPEQVTRIPFEQQRQAVQDVARRSFGDGLARGADSAGRGAGVDTPGRTGGGGTRAQEPAAAGNVGPAASPRNDGGWRRAGEPTVRGGGAASGGAVSTGAVPATQPAAEAGRSSNETNNGWRRVGETQGRGVVEHQAAPAERSTTSPPVGRSSEPAASRAISNDSGAAGWHRFGEPSRSRAPEMSPGSPSPAAPPVMRSEPRDTGRGGDSGGFRRFGETGGSRQPAVEPGNRNVDRGGGRTEAPTTRSAPENRAPQVDRPAPSPERGGGTRGGDRPGRSDAGSGWQRFNGAGSDAGHVSGEPAARQSFASSGSPSPRMETGAGWSSGRSSGFGGGEPVRIAPPIVRERASGASYGGGGMQRMSAPPSGGGMQRMSAPSGGGGRAMAAPSGGGGGRGASMGGGGGSRGGSSGGGGRGGRGR